MKTLVYKTVLVSVFALISANLVAQKYYTTNAGTWESSSLWGATTNGAGALWSTTSLADGDEIQIDNNTDLTTDLTIPVDVNIILDATLNVSNKLRLTENSSIEFTENGRVVGTGPGNSEKISFGGVFLWSGNDGVVTGPGTMDKNYNGTLPVSLVSYTTRVTSENQVVVAWTTVSEENNDYFTLERSEDGKNFEVVATVDGAGISAAVLKYSFTDKNPLFGRSYYRLSQTDFDGTSESFELKTVEISSINDLKVFPNPVNRGNELRVVTGADSGEEVSIEIYNHAGMLVKAEKLPTNTSINIGDDLKAGFYMIQVKSGKVNKSTRLVIK